MTDASTASGAVSHRRMRGPRPTVLAPAFAAISASSAAKPPSAPVTMAIFSFHHRRALLRPAGRAGARRRTRSRTAQGRTVQRCGTRHQSLPAAGPHPAECPGRTAWRLPPQCGCSARSSAPLFGGRHAVPAEEGHDVGCAQLHAVLDDLLQLVLLGVAGQQSDLHAGFGGAGIARLHPELHALVPKAGDGGGVFHGIAVA